MSTVFQCELCAHQFDAEGTRLPFRAVVPELFVCGVCRVSPPVAEKRESVAREYQLREPSVKRPEGNSRSTIGNSRGPSVNRQWPVAERQSHRGCPHDSEDVRVPGVGTRPQAPSTLSARDFHERFVMAPETQERDSRVLRLLSEGMCAAAPQAPEAEAPLVPGKWVNGLEIFKVCGIKAASACASRIRKELLQVGLDFDSRMVPGGDLNEWEYRICPVAVSERMERERRREEERKEKEYQERVGK